MAANIATNANGNAMIAYRGESPWHKQGVRVPDGITGDEFLKAAGLDWKIIETPVCGNVQLPVERAIGMNDDGSLIVETVMENKAIEIPNKKMIIRGDTLAPLGIVGSDYRVVQNERIVQIFDAIANNHKIEYEVAGGLGNGETVWILASIPDMNLNIGDDEVKPYMLIRNGHIGNSTLAVYPTIVRVVCQNTIRAANSAFRESIKRNRGKMDVNTGFSIRHTTNIEENIKQVENAYATMYKDFNLTKDLFEAMMGVPVTTDIKNRFFNSIAGDEKENKRGSTVRKNKLDLLESIYESPTNQTASSKDNLWGLLNTGIEYVDYYRNSRLEDETEDRDAKRFESSMFTSGADMKDEMLIMATQILEGVA